MCRFVLALLLLSFGLAPAAFADHHEEGAVTVEGEIDGCTIRFHAPADILPAGCTNDGIPQVLRIRVSLTMVGEARPKMGTFEAPYSESYILVLPKANKSKDGVWSAESDDPDLVGAHDPEGEWTFVMMTDLCKNLSSATLTIIPGCRR